MVSFDKLNKESHKITELSNVLSLLIEDRLLCDSETCNELFFEYMDNVTEHMHEIDVNMYQDLLRHSSKDMNNVAKNFMSGSQEIKRIMSNYEKRWCKKKNKELSIGAKHEAFLEETSEMFGMVLNRLQDEMEHLYPAVREVTSN